MPVVEVSGDLRAAQQLTELTAMLLIVGGQGIEYVVAFRTTQQPEQRVNPGGSYDVDPFVAGDRRAEELGDTRPGVVADDPQRAVILDLRSL